MDYMMLLFVTLSLGAGAITKGATGMGLPLVALPSLTTAVGLQHAIGIILIPILVSNSWQMWRFRSVRDDALVFLPPFILAGGVGVVLGTWALTAIPERNLVVVLGIILIGYIAFKLARPGIKVGPRLARSLAMPMGLGAGVLQGATGISAPIGVTFIHAMGMMRSHYVFAVSAMFLGFAVVQLPAVILAGIYQPQWLAHGIFALLPVALFMPVGEWLGRRASRETFDRIILLFLGVMGIKMIVGL